MTYAETMIRELLAEGSAAGEDFYRVKVKGKGETKWFNVSPAQLEAIAAVLTAPEFAANPQH